jgi:hypothetical protein
MFAYGSYLFFVLGLSIFVQISSSFDLKNLGSFCSNDSSLGPPNLNPIGDSAAKFVRTVENGSLYTIGNGEDQIWLIHVWGDTGYDMIMDLLMEHF